MARHRCATVVSAAVIAGWMATPGVAAEPAEALDPLASEFRAGVSVLADDAMEGRGLGTQGLARAADWIEERARQLGLRPAFGDSYRQPFQVKVGVEKLDGNRLAGVAEDDWTPLGFSSSGEFAGELAFVGYGIEAPSVGYREMDGIDLRGKVALMLRYEPQDRDDASPFDGRKPSRWSAMRYKVLQARERGAVAVVFVTGPLQDGGQDKLPALKNDGPESPAGLPVVQVRTSVAQRWLARAGVDLDAFQKAVDRDLVPRSKGSTAVLVEGKVALEARYTGSENVAAVLPGRGRLASEVVVVGAHYDHLGMGGDRSMRPNETAVHNGADDNASGVMATLLAAERLREELADVSDHRTILFAWFSAEEVGLAGSSRLVESPPFAVDRVVAMLNLDMVGRLRDDLLVVLGSESGDPWPELIERARASVPGGLQVSSSGDGYGPSDHTSFYASGVPVLHLFTGHHEQYHTPDDDASTVDAKGAAKVVLFTAALSRDLATRDGRVAYRRSSSEPLQRGDSRGYGAYLGTIPDYRAMESTEGGVLLSDVRTGGPADLAGIRGGDRVVEIAGTRIENLNDMTFALQDHKPGQTVVVKVIRDGAPLSLKATLGERAEGSRSGAPAPAKPSNEPASPHGAGAGAAPQAPDFYEDRPGASFVIAAGRPFAATFEGERHLANVRQLTFGGENAEAYFSPDGTKLIYQATVEGVECDRQYVMDLATGEVRQVSSGKGRTTCGYYDWPEADRIVYASTESDSPACPPSPDRSKGYVWILYDGFDIWEANPDGSSARKLTDTPGYDAEATWCHRGGRLVFTSIRDGDLDLYVMDETGDTRRITNQLGYDGGAFFDATCRKLVWRASRPQGEQQVKEYHELLAQRLVRPTAFEIYVADADGSGVKQLTSNGAANFGPYFTPDGDAVIYASNVELGRREFDLYLVPTVGGEPKRVTFAPGFDGFPMFSPDGRYLVWASNRADPNARDTNLFIARWVE